VILVAMGVCGCGKSTVGRSLAEDLGWSFFDADDFHPEANVAKMASGQPLTDDDRWPWLDRIADELRRVLARGDHAVLACSALKHAYRERLKRAGDVRIVYLKGDQATIASRLAGRQHKYMPASLLQSQLATLEEPTDALVVDIRPSVPAQVAFIREQLGLSAPVRS
jgi:carbohydrate kinase (thermoresistant glucokinase family)